MAETVQEKSRGLKFAEQQLLRHGWEQGKGLGRQENGISEAIKVKVKCDKGGVGHRQGEQFTFHWWDHVFNKASSSLEVESGENGVQVKKLVEEEEEGMISNKKPTKAMLGRDKLYGCFVKSATLLAGLEQPEQKSSSTDDSSSDDEDQRLDLSSTTKLSDADLVKACGGRTAHKGARHGLTMSAKLARLEQQEQEFMAKYGKKNQLAATTPDSVTTQPAAQIPEDELTHETPGKKAKKRKNHSEDTRENVAEENADSAVVSGSTNMEIKVKKKKKKESLKENTGEVAVVPVEEELTSVEDNSADNAQPTKRKRSKRRKVLEEGESCHLNGEVCETDVISVESDAGGGCEDASEGEGATRQQTDSDTTTKKKKKSSKNKEVAEEKEHSKDRETNQSETVADSPPKKKKKRDETIERKEVRTVEEEPKIKGKKKKCKEVKQTVEDRLHDVLDSIPLKKKKKKAKQQEPV
ncbi:G patch domain-containing protein 4 [Salvelinus fontinalis]|uniref:G patch domain-containing protein 4 n=1 Tax=Salvelinus fontinalis TaxID=8038 RepID=UPI002485216E|nr:G patch domain-containing protein 4 [Salvelinus fontinalis]XP_055759865.1 G patch domain-containing protein 4 [Salvelinus fontinalis]